MVKLTKQLMVPLLIALGVLAGLGFLMSPAGVTANTIIAGPEQLPVQEPPAQLGEQAVVVSGSDFRISAGNSARSPEIAANNEFAALVYAQNSRIWLRSAQKGSGWGVGTLLSTNGAIPKLAFRTGSTNTLYVVWEEATAIRFRRCTLADPVNVCSNTISIASVPVANASQLRTPDVAVNGNRVFVAWVDRKGPGSADNVIRLALSTNNGQNWTISGTDVPLAVGDDAGLPALAATNTHVHLVYKDGSSPWTIEYRRFGVGLGAPNASKSFLSGADTHGNYGAMNNPAIAVNGAKVFLLWDNKHSSATYYGLTGVENSNNGNNASWGTVKHIPSQTAATTDNAANRKKSKDSGPPNEEATLLPSVTISGTTFAAVWQQKPQEECQTEGGTLLNDTSEIYFTPNVNSAGAAWGTLANSRSDYALDPDVDRDNNGTHIVFMKDESIPNCGTGGETSEYGVFYRGPFSSDSDKIKRQLMPILKLN